MHVKLLIETTSSQKIVTSKGSCRSWKRIVKSLDDGKFLVDLVVLSVSVISVVRWFGHSVVSVVMPKLKCQSAKELHGQNAS